MGHIVACALNLDDSQEAHLRNLKDGDIFPYTPWVIDGHHRRLALQNARVPTSMKTSTVVKLWYRNDGRSMSETEMLRIGAGINNAASKVRPTSLLDKMYSCVSYCRTLQESVYLDVGKLSRLIKRDALLRKNVDEAV